MIATLITLGISELLTIVIMLAGYERILVITGAGLQNCITGRKIRLSESEERIMTLEQEEKIFQQWRTTNKPLPEIAKPERREPWQDNETKEEARPEQAAEPETEAEEATEEEYEEHAVDSPEPEETEQPEAKTTVAEQKIQERRAKWRAWYYRNKANKGKADKKASRRGKSAPVPLKINAITGQPSTEIENMVAEAEQKLEQATETLIAEIREKLRI